MQHSKGKLLLGCVSVVTLGALVYAFLPQPVPADLALVRRGPLRVTVEVPGSQGEKPYDLTLYVVHSKSGGPGEYWRNSR